MTEYDYSPEAYRRQMETQARIAKWVDSTTHSPPPQQSPRDLAPPPPELDDLTPGHSISQYHPSPPPGAPYAFGGPPPYAQQNGNARYMYAQQAVPLGLPGPTPYGAVYAPAPPQHHHHHHRDSRSSSSSHRSRSHSHPRRPRHRSKSPSTTAYIIAPPLPGPTPYGYPASPPITPGIPGVPPPSFVVQVPRGKKVQLVSSPPISPPPYQNGFLQPYPLPPQPYSAGVPQQPYSGTIPQQPYSAGMHPGYFPPQPPFQQGQRQEPTFLPMSAAPQFMQRAGVAGYPAEWRRSF
ncbi:hypothetical protein PC9H_007498 [Pleurotus ostreatus]|uniref:Uncharacterized protein n=1 Tax=Pleurotus ostreatus TaxID=5322 RepID=A0A8H6ZY90_PLEOS|nr:uncharacterized protein PC9H_007498 [Pleurotus ostreatus]KAF7428277.1 hypothetical protein PC9H_007498 [Pleurotus ostreatus]KAJ8696377.1 hypothetical protein PTI98_006251 [Pleurotus ostreatus]